MLIDTHTHLEMSQFDTDRDSVIDRAKKAGVGYIIVVGSDIAGNEGAVSLSESYDIVYTAVGIHPHEVKGADEKTYERVLYLAKKEKVVAYGEIGLDYHYEFSPKDLQILHFRRQINFAKELKLPMIVHSREAKKDTLKILKEEKAEEVGGVFHCFSGDLEMAQEAISMGFHISIAGTVTFEKAQRVQQIVREIPIENLLIETDSPYLAPVPYRGKRNEPAYVRYVAQKIAELKGLTSDDVARITTFNAMSLFKIGKMEDEGKVAYPIRDSLYLNITNRCTSACTFCVRYYTDFVKGHNLRLTKEPTKEEVIETIGNPKRYKEIVFCGYGEPLIRLDIVKEASRYVKDRGGTVRIDTNGHGNLIHKRNILPELSGLVDSISISLNADTEEEYNRLCQPLFGPGSYEKVKEFIREAKRHIPDVSITVVALPSIDLRRCDEIAKELGIKLRVREYNVVG